MSFICLSLFLLYHTNSHLSVTNHNTHVTLSLARLLTQSVYENFRELSKYRLDTSPSPSTHKTKTSQHIHTEFFTHTHTHTLIHFSSSKQQKKKHSYPFTRFLHTYTTLPIQLAVLGDSSFLKALVFRFVPFSCV